MAYIQTNNSLPGILELLYYKESTGKALSALAHTLLHGPSNLTPAERELIAAHVSSLNQCSFCAASHGAAASAHLKDEGALAAAVQSGSLDALSLSSKMKQLLELASLVQKGGREIKPQNVEAARSAGASDEEIHDAILIASAFCMYNRYVDGLGTAVAARAEDYVKMGARLSKAGYKYPPFFLRSFVKRLLQKAFGRAPT
jgi:uncharacterized peroxidase-related enzyme